MLERGDQHTVRVDRGFGRDADVPRRESSGARARAGAREARHRRLCDLLQRRGAAAVQSRRRPAPLVRVRAGDRRLRRDARSGSVLRDGRMGHRAEPVGQSVRRRHPSRRRCCSRGATRSNARGRLDSKTDRERAYVDAVSQLYADFETIDQPTRVCGVSRCDGESSRRPIPNDTEAIDLLRVVDRRRRVAGRQDVRRSAEGRRDSREAHRHASRIIRASRTTSFTATTCRRSPIARSRPRGVTRRSRRRRRTRCTCRRTRSRGSATGRSRSTPTSRLARSRSATARSPKNCTRWTTGSMRTCRRRRTRARDSCSTRCPRWRRASIPTPSDRRAPGSAGVFALAAIPARYALERGAWAEAAKLEPQPSKFPVHRGAHVLRARDRRRAHRRHGDRPLVDRGAAEDPGSAHARRRKRYWAGQTEIQRRSASAWLAFAERRQADALDRDARRRRARGRHREGGGHAGSARARARAARRDAAGAQTAGGGAEGVRGHAEEGAEPLPRRATAPRARQRSRAIVPRPGGYYDQLLKICERADKPGRSELVDASRTMAAR